MDKRNLALVLSALIVVALGMLWWLGAPSSKRVPQTPAEATPTVAPYGSPQPDIAQATPTEGQIPGGLPEPSDPRWKEREVKRQIDPEYEWKTPINFFGRVVDENEQPVREATVVGQWSDLSPNGATAETRLTDDQGLFSIIGKKGRGITIRVSKEGYYTPKQQQISFDYAGFWEANYHKPDPHNPVVFHLRKKNQGKALSSGEIRPTLPANGTPVRFDLLNGGRASPDGQLEIAAVTNTEKYPPRIFNWRATISMPDGGLIEHNAEFPFEAPETGYQQSVEFDMSTNVPDWNRLIEKSYFIQFGSPPKYGRIQIRLNGASPKASVSYWVNPSGSRNLEESSKEQVSSR